MPTTVDTMTTTSASRSVTDSASSSSWSVKRVGYQSRVKPFQFTLRFESLNEKMIRTTIGANRKI